MLAQIIEAMGYAQAHNSILLINVMIRRAVEFEQKASEYQEDASRIKLICKDFLQLEMSGEIESALKKVI